MTSSEPNHKRTPQTQTDKDQLVERWRCPNCGQQHFTACDQEPPDVCAYCQDMTTWEHLPPGCQNGLVP